MAESLRHSLGDLRLPGRSFAEGNDDGGDAAYISKRDGGDPVSMYGVAAIRVRARIISHQHHDGDNNASSGANSGMIELRTAAASYQWALWKANCPPLNNSGAAPRGLRRCYRAYG